MSAFAFVASRVALSTLHQSLQHTLTLKKASHHYSPVTSPAVSLHTFNGSGNNGTFWTTSQDGVIWTMVNCLDDAMSTPPSETFEPSTSPAVAVYQDTLYVVWNSSAANGTLRYTYVNKATNAFVQPKNLTAGGLSIRSQTSPAMVEFNGLLYLFFNGSGLNGTWMTTSNGNVWAIASPVTSNLGGNFMDRTSPAIFVSDDKRVLTLLWYGSGSNGTWYTTTTNGITWSNQVVALVALATMDDHTYSLLMEMGTCGTMPGSYYSTLTEPKYSLAMDAFLKGNDFAFVAQDDATVKYLEAQFANGSVIIQNPSSSPNIIQSANPRNQTVAGNANWINLWHYFYNGSPSAIPREAVSLLALATLAFNFNYLISINTDSQMRFSPRLVFHRIPPNKG
ncbi:Glycosyl hydrolase, five-bladed beta-propellor domain superfamily [Fusarium oxysporum f. sp. vasinfectum]|nr:Glycosyl hydrolase, five-bladed beta-propellor domain superfamily [Fusarium oxysporum f. sp. vasinfectum]